jgi:ankyrin repeat protein
MQNTFDTPAEVLHAAVRDKDLDRLQRLLVQEHIQDLNGENYAWGTPLHITTWCDTIQAVRLLLHAGTNPLIQWEQANFSLSAIQLAASTGNHTILREF